MDKKKRYISLMALLAGSLAAPAFAVNAGVARPLPENYPSYSQYLQAVFEYRKSQGSSGSEADKLCRDDQQGTGAGSGDDKRKNSCQEKQQSAGSTDISGGDARDAASHEDLDEAVAKANAGVNPGYIDDSNHPRSTFKSFPLSPIPVTDMSQMGVNGLLGYLGALISQRQTPPGTPARQRADNAISLEPDTTLRIINDDYSLMLAEAYLGGLNFGGVLHLDNGGTGYVEATAASTATGASITMSSQVRTGLKIVDRDGYPASAFSGAGAIVVDSIGVSFRDVHADISATNRGNTGSNDLLNAQIFSPSAIIVDLSGTHVGVADAMPDGSAIGASSTAVSFGPNSVLRIEPGMSMTTVLSHPDGVITPLLTLNGNIGNLSLADVALMDNANTLLHIGQITVQGVQLVNTRIYLDQQKLIMDMGTGMTNLGVALERISMGNNPVTGMLGDLYVNHANINNMRMTVEAH